MLSRVIFKKMKGLGIAEIADILPLIVAWGSIFSFHCESSRMLPSARPLRTTPLRPDYIGEETPNNPGSWTGNNGPVKYLTDGERGWYKLAIKNGKLYDAQGKPFNTMRATTWAGEAKAIYIMDEQGNIYASKYQEVFKFHHSSLASGQSVAGAGEMEVEDGILRSINNRSGHYRPSPEFLDQTVDELHRQGLNLNETTIERD